MFNQLKEMLGFKKPATQASEPEDNSTTPAYTWDEAVAIGAFDETAITEADFGDLGDVR